VPQTEFDAVYLPGARSDGNRVPNVHNRRKTSHLSAKICGAGDGHRTGMASLEGRAAIKGLTSTDADLRVLSDV
jgi:hypothetical protein